MTLEALIAEDEAARLLGLSPRTLQAERVRGTGMAFVKMGRRVLYEPVDLRARIAANKVRSTNEAQQLLDARNSASENHAEGAPR
jgi:hypothetical protein